jgi:hypothetical protein
VRRSIRLAVFAACVLGLAAWWLPASASHNQDRHSPNTSLLFSSPNGRNTTNSDIAFWGKYAYQGDYGGLRIFDLTNPASPSLVGNLACAGAQVDPTVFDRDGNGQADIAFLSVDRTMANSNCGAATTAHDDPNGWEGLRIVNIANPASPTQIGTVYLDCGSHTNVLWPDPENNRVLLYNMSYPLRPGPSCGPVRGPATGRDPLHGVIQVVEVSWNPASPLGAVTAKEIAEPKVTYPGDADNKFVPQEHGLGAATDPTLVQGMRACHDASVFVPLRLVAAACAEQAQLWRVLPNGLPDTENPIWVYDDQNDETGTTGSATDPGIVVDFWHSATFSWDGRIVHFEDESFSSGSCPPTTPAPGETATYPGDTGRMFFFDTQTGTLLSQFMPHKPWETEYCSAHLGNVVPATDKNLLVFAWYMGGTTVIDFTNPFSPQEVAYYDAAGPPAPPAPPTPLSPAGPNSFDNWAAYWYEGPGLTEESLTIYATDGVHDPVSTDGGARGFNVLRVNLSANEVNFSRLNPQTQEQLIPAVRCRGRTATYAGLDGRDTLVGTSGDDVIAGQGGNDIIRGLGGRDRLCGASGRDRVAGGGGGDRISGNRGADRLSGGPGNDNINGGPMRDRCIGGPGRDTFRNCEVIVD